MPRPRRQPALLTLPTMNPTQAPEPVSELIRGAVIEPSWVRNDCQCSTWRVVRPSGDVLYLKVDPVTRGDYERAGAAAFKPYPDRPGTMQYYAVPLDVLESAFELTAWAQKAVDAAERGKRSIR